jgi:hypothetical protein
MEQDHFLHRPAASFFLVPYDSSQCVLRFERKNGLMKPFSMTRRGRPSSVRRDIPNCHLPMTIKVILIQSMMPATVVGGNKISLLETNKCATLPCTKSGEAAQN